MPNYQKAKIYKIESYSNPELVYYGSTCQTLAQRMGVHRHNYREGNPHNLKSYNVLEIGDAHIVLIECYPCNSKEELHSREAYYIKNYNCVNKTVPLRTKKEYYQDNIIQIKQRDKKYYLDNKQKIIKRNSEYNANHIDHRREQQKEHYQKHRDIILAKQAVKIECECGTLIRKGDIAEHRRSKKHLDMFNMNEEEKNNVKANKKDVLIINCQCGSSVQKSGFNRHKKTPKHMKWEQELDKEE
eukprot:Lithocolla_globosa_v1_NODE_6407_length_1092_cov_8.579556.p1 type:complete len:243 gc:universal NODE_6407_length_1092_cov_8.579556:956-228(-)